MFSFKFNKNNNTPNKNIPNKNPQIKMLLELISLPDEKYYANFKKEDVTILLQGILNNNIDLFQTIKLYSLSGHVV